MPRVVCLLLAVGLLSCDKQRPVRCSEGCAQYGAVCNQQTQVCERRSGSMDMSMSCPPVCGPDMAPMCTDSSICSAATPVCNAQGRCSGCGTAGPSTECATYHGSTSPPTSLCGPNGACVECLTKDDCAARNLTCDTSANACAPCKSNSDCSSGVCKLACTSTGCAYSGACASPDDIAKVDSTASLKTALTGTKPIILLAAGSYDTSMVTYSGTRTLVGPGGHAGKGKTALLTGC
jgi:hypothetical protein